MKRHFLATVIPALFLGLCIATPAIAQDKVTGKVTDNNGVPLNGVTVTVKNGHTATATNEQGIFTIPAAGNAILVFSSSGYATKEELVNNRKEVNVALARSVATMEDVVVVGYGTQKKINLTGAVDQVGKEVFEDRPMPNVVRGLQGVIPNLNIKMVDGKPTRGATYNIRGITSIGGGGSALVLIDGVPGDPNLLNPNDIATVSVLKDASSAAIYGARGAFGVVLITTKSPRHEKVQVSYNGNYSINQRTVTPQMVWDGYTWAKMFDEAFSAWNNYNSHPSSVNNAWPFSLDYLDSLKARHDNPNLPRVTVDPSTGRYVYYGSTNWFKEAFNDDIPSMEHALSISGSSDKINYYLSGRYFSQGSLYRYNEDDFDKYNFRVKGDIKVTDWLKINNNLDFSSFKYESPLGSVYSGNGAWRTIADQGFPMAIMFNPDGTLTQHAVLSGVGDYYQARSQAVTNESYIRNMTGFAISLRKNQLSIKGDFTYSFKNTREKRKFFPASFSAKPGEITDQGINMLTEGTAIENYYAINLYSELNQQWGRHDFKALVGYNLESFSLKNQYVQRDLLLNPDLPDFNLTNGLNYKATGGGYEWGIVGVFYRLNYGFDGKYLFELNGRYDGSSKFPESQRFGFFPSASAGWRISEENFIRNSLPWLNNLKLRASYGSLGNGQVDPYLFLESLQVAQSNVLLGGVFPSYTQKPRVVPDDLTWEKSTTLDFGMDMGVLNNRLTATFDWYERNTTGMFTPLQPLPRTFGADVPQGNNANLQTRGWELSLGWKDEIPSSKPFSYGLRVVLADNETFITKYNNPTGSLATFYEGQRYGEIWGYVTDGLFTSNDDINNHADQSFIPVSASNILMPGDVKFRDLNKDGKINYGDNTVSNPGDLTIIGNTQPRYTYGINLDVSWNNFSLDAFFQGVGKRDWWPGTEGGFFWGQYNRPYGYLPQHIIDNYWTEDNPNAYFPRYRGYVAQSGSRELGVVQSRYLQDVSYIRLKNIVLSYSLPVSLVNKWRLSGLRIYFTGQNLWTYSNMFKITKNFDPEVIEESDPDLSNNDGKGYSYPMLKSFTFGINVTF